MVNCAIAALQGGGIAAVGGERAEGLRHGLEPAEKFVVRHHVTTTGKIGGAVARRLARHHEVARLRVGQGLEQDGVDNAEYGGVGADAKGQQQDDKRAEQHMGAQRTKGGFKQIHGGESADAMQRAVL